MAVARCHDRPTPLASETATFTPVPSTGDTVVVALSPGPLAYFCNCGSPLSKSDEIPCSVIIIGIAEQKLLATMAMMVSVAGWPAGQPTGNNSNNSGGHQND